MKVIGKISGQALVDAYGIAESIPLTNTVHSGYAPNRVEAWYRYSSNLQSIANGRGKITLNPEPHERLVKLGDRYLPNWHSLLVCGGDTTINWHRDHGHFAAHALMLNLGDAYYYEQPNRNSDEVVRHHLSDGLVVLIDTKLLHRAEQLSSVRYNFTFRRIKPQFIPA